MNEHNLIYLADEQVLSLGLSTRQIVESIESAIEKYASDALWAAPKSVLLPGDGRYIMSTLSAADEPGIIAVKSMVVSPNNPARGLPGVNGAIMLLDSETGELLGVMDAGSVTALRTAGLSAVVAKRMANPNATSVAFIGCGVQARSHLDAFMELFPITDVHALGRSKANVNKFCKYAREKGVNASLSKSPRDAIQSADIIVSSITLSYETAPFLDANWLRPGAFAAITDLAIPWFPKTIPALGEIIIDDREQEATADKPMVDANLISADIVELVTDKHLKYSPDLTSAFIFRGLALGDFAVAALAYRSARDA